MDSGNLIRNATSIQLAGIANIDMAQVRASTIREFGGRGRTQFAIAALHRMPISLKTIGDMRENHGQVLQAARQLFQSRDKFSGEIR